MYSNYDKISQLERTAMFWLKPEPNVNNFFLEETAMEDFKLRIQTPWFGTEKLEI